MGWQDRSYNREENGGIPPVAFSFPKISRLTLVLIATCLVAYLVQSFTRSIGSPLEYWGMLTFEDALAFKQPWRWITYQYLHAGAMHFVFNMLGLYFFLPSLEGVWGWKKAFGFYTLGGICAGVLFGVFSAFNYNGYLIGASGSVLATLGACALLFPSRQLILLVFPVPIRVAAALFGAVYLLSAVADRNLADSAHLGGLAFGFFAPMVSGRFVPQMRRKWEKSRAQRSRQAEIDDQTDVDRILQKVTASGMNSLTSSERKSLKRATQRQQDRDRAHDAKVRRATR